MLKKLTMLVALTLLLLSVAFVQADSMDGEVFCGDLSDADCQILLDNAALMDEVYSAAFSMTMEMNIAGESGNDDMQLSMNGQGSMAGDPAVADKLMALESATEAASMSALLEELFAALQGEIMLNMTGAMPDAPMDMTLNLLIKDGVIAMNAGAMESMTGESMGGMEWFGFDTSGALGDMLAGAGMGSMADMSDMSSPAMEKAGAQATAITRLPDEMVAGIPVAVFESSIDLNAMLSQMTMGDTDAAAGAEHADADMALAMAQSIEAREVSSRHYIGIDDLFTHRMFLAMDMTIGSDFTDLSEGDVDLSMHIDIMLSGFNQPVEVVIPEDAMILPLAMMLQMGNQ